jgi:hypothetical protein
MRSLRKILLKLRRQLKEGQEKARLGQLQLRELDSVLPDPPRPLVSEVGSGVVRFLLEDNSACVVYLRDTRKSGLVEILSVDVSGRVGVRLIFKQGTLKEARPSHMFSPTGELLLAREEHASALAFLVRVRELVSPPA